VASTAGPTGFGRAVEGPGRRRDLDLMRVAVVVGLVFFHTARVFDTASFYVKNEPTSELVTIAVAFVAMWGMPLLFVVAGIGIWYSLRSRSTTAFAGERLLRLVVPLVFGVLVIVPPQVWTRLRADPAYDEPYQQFLPRFFDVDFSPTSFPFVISADPDTGLFEPAHLWFIVILFAFSMLLLPVIWLTRTPTGMRITDRIAQQADALWFVVAAGLPYGVLEAVFGSEASLAGWSRYSYALFILYGYVLASDRRLGRALRRHRRSALILGIATFLVVGALFAIGSSAEGADPAVDTDAASLTMRTVRGVSGWLWIVAIMGYAAGSRGAGKATPGPAPSSPRLDRISAYMSEAVLPVYVLHQTVIVLLAFYVVQWRTGAVLKYLTISLLSLLVILVIYDLAIRRTRPTRFLFGMKPHDELPAHRDPDGGG
jgi:hypothetical protein